MQTMLLRFVFLADVDDRGHVVHNVHFQLRQRRHLSADGRTLPGVQFKDGQLRADEILGNVRDEMQWAGRAGVLGQRQMFVEVAQVRGERQKVVGTRPVLQPQVRRTFQSVLELIPEPRRRDVDPGDAVDRRRAATASQRARSPNVRPEPRARTRHEDRHRALPVLVERVHVLQRHPSLRQTQQSTVVNELRRGAISRLSGFIHVQTVAVDVAVDAVLLARRRVRRLVRRRLRRRRSRRLVVVFRQFLLPVLRRSRSCRPQAVDGRQRRLTMKPVSTGYVPLGHNVVQHSAEHRQN